MEKVKAGLRGLSAEHKVTRARVVHEAMSGNPDFPDALPMLNALLAAADRLNEANIAAIDRGRIACANKGLAEAAIGPIFSRLAAYVNSVAIGDTNKLLGSGFELGKRPAPLSELPAPARFNIHHSPFPGRVKLAWSSVQGALVYEVEANDGNLTDQQQWQRVALVSRPTALVAAKGTRKVFCFRVRAVGAKAISPYTNTKGRQAA